MDLVHLMPISVHYKIDFYLIIYKALGIPLFSRASVFSFDTKCVIPTFPRMPFDSQERGRINELEETEQAE